MSSDGSTNPIRARFMELAKKYNWCKKTYNFINDYSTRHSLYTRRMINGTFQEIPKSYDMIISEMEPEKSKKRTFNELISDFNYKANTNSLNNTNNKKSKVEIIDLTYDSS